MALLTTPRSHVEKYIGLHAQTDDFTFQEQMRTSDLSLKELVKSKLGASKAEKFFVNGWGQIISAAYIQTRNPLHLKISDAFGVTLQEEIQKATHKAKEQKNPFETLNVRAPSKSIMMYPHAGQYFPFMKVDISKPVEYLNQFVKDAELEFALYEGKLYLRINPEDEQNIFNKLWKTEFVNLLGENGYTAMEKNKECPHVTLINSDVIAKIREQFEGKYGKSEGGVRFETFFIKILEKLNQELKEKTNPLIFTELASTYSEDYSPFEEVVVAKLESSIVETSLKFIVEETKKELEIEIPVKPRSSFHLTIATKYRQPSLASEELKSIEDVLNGTGALSETFNSFWKELASI